MMLKNTLRRVALIALLMLQAGVILLMACLVGEPVHISEYQWALLIASWFLGAGGFAASGIKSACDDNGGLTVEDFIMIPFSFIFITMISIALPMILLATYEEKWFPKTKKKKEPKIIFKCGSNKHEP